MVIPVGGADRVDGCPSALAEGAIPSDVDLSPIPLDSEMRRTALRPLALATALLLGLAACDTEADDADDGPEPTTAAAASTTPAATASETVDASVPPDPEEPAQSATEQSDLAVTLGELPLPPGSAPLSEAVSEGNTVSQTFTVQGIQEARDVLSEDYLATLEDADWEVDEPVEERGDGVAATLRREEVELLLVAQDGPADDPENAVLNIVLSGDAE